MKNFKIERDYENKKYICKNIIPDGNVRYSRMFVRSWMRRISPGQSAEEYFATAVGYESLINGCYNTLKSVYNTTNYNVISQLGTDIVTQNDIDAPSLATLNKYILYQSDNGFVYTQWTNLYAALKNVNAAIDLLLM